MSSTKRKSFSEEKKASLLEKIQKELPVNWIAQFSKKHESRVYFFNKADGTRTWEHPGLSHEHKKPRSKRKSNETKNSFDLSQSVVTDRNRADESKKRKFNERTVSTNFEENCANSQSTSTVKRKKKRKKDKKSNNCQNDKKFSFIKSFSSVSFSSDKDNCEKRQSLDNVSSHEACSSSSNTHHQPQSLQTTLTAKDVEMTEVDLITPAQEPDSTSNINSSFVLQQEFCSDEKSKLVLVIDTNVLFHKNHQSDLEEFVHSRQYKNNKPTDFECVIPWVVLQELDGLKQNKSPARSAISFLNRHFQVPESAIRGQTIFEAATVIDGLTVENNDDRILQCCFLMKQASENNIPTLWTLDKNLMNKALANNIKCCENISDIKKIVRKSENEAENLSTSFETRFEKAKLVNSDKNNNTVTKSTPQKPSVLSSEELRSIYEQSIVRIKSSLAFILENAMKDAFDDLWLDIVFRKPPWSLKDVLHCIRKHWQAVFKLLGVDTIIQVHVDRLLSLQNSFVRERAEHIAFVTKWTASGLGLISGINQRGNYGNPVKDDLKVLRNLHKSLKTGKLMESEDEHQIANHKSCEQQPEEVVEMILVEETDFSDFWAALDKIWTSIISHCGMIFQSLSFVPSRINDAPEVCQALSATFETIPEKSSATQALPLVIDLVQSLLVSFQKVFALSGTSSECATPFGDLLQTLWTTIQAFSIDCSIRRLFSVHRELCNNVVSSDDTMNRLKAGSHQLEVVKDLLKECLSALSANPSVIFR